MELVLDQPRVLLGRGPGVDLVLDESSLERVHAAFEFDGWGYRLQQVSEDGDLALNGAPAASGPLKHEDRFRVGEVSFSYLAEPRKPGAL
jgi:hypothetical protein